MYMIRVIKSIRAHSATSHWSVVCSRNYLSLHMMKKAEQEVASEVRTADISSTISLFFLFQSVYLLIKKTLFQFCLYIFLSFCGISWNSKCKSQVSSTWDLEEQRCSSLIASKVIMDRLCPDRSPQTLWVSGGYAMHLFCCLTAYIMAPSLMLVNNCQCFANSSSPTEKWPTWCQSWRKVMLHLLTAAKREDEGLVGGERMGRFELFSGFICCLAWPLATPFLGMFGKLWVRPKQIGIPVTVDENWRVFVGERTCARCFLGIWCL